MTQKRNEKAMQAWVLTLASLASFMISLDSLVVSTALPTIRLYLLSARHCPAGTPGL